MPNDPSKDAFEATLAEKTAQTNILHRLQAFVDPETDQALVDPLVLAAAIYKRVHLERSIRDVELSSSWDYCKVATIDWLKGQRRWIPIHEDAHWYQLGCVPPHFQYGDRMMCGEAYSGPFHLTTYRRYGDKYYCCLLTKREVMDEAFLAKLPFADDLPVMGEDKKEEVGA
jgi:hypothetical protein